MLVEERKADKAGPGAGPGDGQRAGGRAGKDERLFALAADRVAIEGVSPEIEGGRFPAKCVSGEPVLIAADVFGDGHDTVDACVLYRAKNATAWTEEPLAFVVNDRWQAHLVFDGNGPHEYTFLAWRDLYAQWRKEIGKKHAAGQTIELELTEGRMLLEAAAGSDRASEADASELRQVLEAAQALESPEQRLALLTSDAVAAVMKRAAPRTNLSRYDKVLEIFADRKRAAFSAWYELFPRSQSGDLFRHGTLRDVIKRLPYISDLGFDVLYFTPIHPIGATNRKGRNNTLTPGPDDVGSPYAIGSAEGGHDALHPELGTFDDFKVLVEAAHGHGLEIAIDFAIQCSPDHPWIKQHPEWFDWRPDGTIKFAENPPKKYEDIVNVHFYRDALPSIWHALRDVVLFWAEHGVKIFRVDNPHTKPFPFWEWMIGEVRAKHPDAIFLAEAFTRPKIMKRLAKVGFNQSYSYFTWRNTKRELTEYMTELTTEECADYMRVNFFANTPDINPPYLQTGGRPAHQTRLILAATLGGNYGLYNGFEINDATPVPGKEEYLNSEKYELRVWDMDRPDNIRGDIAFVNRLRRGHPALQDFRNVAFLNAWNDNVLYYAKRTADRSDYLLFLVCLDPHNAQHADFEVPLWELDLPDDATVAVEDMVAGTRFSWTGKYQHIHLDPFYKPYAVYRLIPPGAAH